MPVKAEVSMRILNAVALALCVFLMPARSEGQGRTGLSQEEVNKINQVSETFAKAVLSKD